MAQLSAQSPDRKGGFFDFLTGSLQKPAQSPDRQGISLSKIFVLMDRTGGKRLGTHTLVHRSDLNQMLKASPQHGDAGRAIAFPVQGTAQQPLVFVSQPFVLCV